MQSCLPVTHWFPVNQLMDEGGSGHLSPQELIGKGVFIYTYIFTHFEQVSSHEETGRLLSTKILIVRAAVSGATS